MERLIQLVEDFDSKTGKEYDSFLLSTETAMFYHSRKYHALLCDLLDSRCVYLIASVKQEIVAVFPLMYKTDPDLGTVFNSIPYYGSNGGFVFADALTKNERHEIMDMVLTKLETFVRNKNGVLLNIVSNPFHTKDNEWFLAHFEQVDSRIGQITALPAAMDSLEQDLLALFDNPRPRNIRRARKAGVTVTRDSGVKSFEFLYNVHKENIESIGGISKRKEFFDLIPKYFDNDDYSIYVARIEGKPVAALLLFYFNGVVEYFTPATLHDHRNDQPSAMIIFEAMKDACTGGYTHWNWGGTWESQEGVYNFKKKWGAQDYPYTYFNNIYDSSIKEVELEKLKIAFPNFYLFPY